MTAHRIHGRTPMRSLGPGDRELLIELFTPVAMRGELLNLDNVPELLMPLIARVTGVTTAELGDVPAAVGIELQGRFLLANIRTITHFFDELPGILQEQSTIPDKSNIRTH